jgi:hypothetical protein
MAAVVFFFLYNLYVCVCVCVCVLYYAILCGKQILRKVRLIRPNVLSQVVNICLFKEWDPLNNS